MELYLHFPVRFHSVQTPYVPYASPTVPYVFYDAMLLLVAETRRQYSAIYYHYYTLQENKRRV